MAVQIDPQLVEKITRAVLDRLNTPVQDDGLIPVGLSNRHVHLDQTAVDRLFGEGYQLTKLRDLSQPGQFACKETVTLVGPKGSIERVRILGPVRKRPQVELLTADCLRLGLAPTVIDSGATDGAQEIELAGPGGTHTVRAAMVAGRHIHMHPADAHRLGVSCGQRVAVESAGPRAVVFKNVLVRVSEKFALDFHIDLEEGNAAGLRNGDRVRLVRA